MRQPSSVSSTSLEIASGKVKALGERGAARDLHDLARLGRRSPTLHDDPLPRALVVRAISPSDPFPQRADPVEPLARFHDPPADVIVPLRPVLAAGEEATLHSMRDAVAQLLAPLSRPSSKGEEPAIRRSPSGDDT